MMYLDARIPLEGRGRDVIVGARPADRWIRVETGQYRVADHDHRIEIGLYLLRSAEAAHRLISASRAYWSISANSAALKSRLLRAPTQSSTCSGRLAPMSADVTRPPRSTQASAICASVWPRRCAIAFSARILAMFFSLRKSGLRDLPWA